jgi:hypothetical protein
VSRLDGIEAGAWRTAEQTSSPLHRDDTDSGAAARRGTLPALLTMPLTHEPA